MLRSPDILLLLVVASATSCTGLITGKDCGTYASSWTTVSDYVYAFGKNSTAQRITTDSRGTVYAGIEAVDSTGRQHAVLRSSSDQGGTWKDLADYRYLTTQDTNLRGLTVDSSGRLFMGGFSSDGTALRWLTLRSADAGASVALQPGGEDFQLIANLDSQVSMITTDRNGNLFAVGLAKSAASTQDGLIRKSTDGGATWTTVDDLICSSGKSTFDRGVTADFTGTYYVAGSCDEGAGQHEFVRLLGAAPGSYIDNYQLASGKTTTINDGLYIDSVGNFFVPGTATDSGNVQHWFVRKGTSTPGSFSTVDDFQLSSGQSALANTIGSDIQGALVVTGWGADSSGAHHLITRRSLDRGSTWTTSDDYQYATGQLSRAVGLARDRTGNLYVSGAGTDSNGAIHAIVRKLACQPVTY
ncbi:MAG: hypothetical protein ACXVBW_07160 [Bdellovibrionota bacterium]